MHFLAPIAITAAFAIYAAVVVNTAASQLHAKYGLNYPKRTIVENLIVQSFGVGVLRSRYEFLHKVRPDDVECFASTRSAMNRRIFAGFLVGAMVLFLFE